MEFNLIPITKKERDLTIVQTKLYRAYMRGRTPYHPYLYACLEIQDVLDNLRSLGEDKNV